MHVCPTGIDIRNGTQLECVNCTACIDACDRMMEGVGLPKGADPIRQRERDAPTSSIPFHHPHEAYSAVLVVLVAVMVTLVVTRTRGGGHRARTRHALPGAGGWPDRNLYTSLGGEQDQP